VQLGWAVFENKYKVPFLNVQSLQRGKVRSEKIKFNHILFAVLCDIYIKLYYRNMKYIICSYIKVTVTIAPMTTKDHS
jgi:hypothetical protein